MGLTTSRPRWTIFTNVLQFAVEIATFERHHGSNIKSKRTRKREPIGVARRQYDYTNFAPPGARSERTIMIKRNKSATSPSPGRSARTPALSRSERAALNERPVELNTAPHDPDSETAWMAEGNCRLHPPATFFPSDGVGVDRARKICRDCPVVSACLEYALDARIDHGVWGACSERERRRILKRRRDELATSTTGEGIDLSV